MQPQQTTARDDGERDWRNLSCDIAWEAAASGVIHCRSVLNRREDLFRAVEGVTLRAIVCDRTGRNASDLLEDGRRLRHIRVRLPKNVGLDHIYMSATHTQRGVIVGTFSAVEPATDENFQGQLSFLSHITASRDREEGFRREAEIMLRGLRLLLGEATAVEKLRRLSALMVEAIQGGVHVVIKAGRDGLLRPLEGGGASLRQDGLAAIWREQGAPVVIYGAENPHTETLRILLGARPDAVALIFLPVASESIVVICAPRRTGFSQTDVGFASRFALILQQALMLKEEQDKLVQAGKLSVLGQMSASLAHELRQPLNTISMAAQNLTLMVQNGSASPEQVTSKAARILAQVDRAAQIMDRIRQFSRTAGENFSLTELRPLTEVVLSLAAPTLHEGGVRLEIDVPAGLSVRCDAIQVEQVLANLVRNAADVLNGIGTAGKTENGLITIKARATAEGVVLRVEDNGPGFPGNMAERPLETFFTTKGADAGTGLGLSICHTIAREHGGRLALGNHEAGAYVELHLPERGT